MALVDPAALVFLDETSTSTTLTPLYARAPRGARAVWRVPSRSARADLPDESTGTRSHGLGIEVNEAVVRRFSEAWWTVTP